MEPSLVVALENSATATQIHEGVLVVRFTGPPTLVTTVIRSPVLAIDPVQSAAADEFIKKHITAVGINREVLGDHYKNDSILTAEGEKFQGAESVIAKLKSFPLHAYSSAVIDYQPSPVPGGVMALVSGKIQLPPENPLAQQQLTLSQTLHLLPTPLGSYYVSNHMFRVTY